MNEELSNVFFSLLLRIRLKTCDYNGSDKNINNNHLAYHFVAQTR